MKKTQKTLIIGFGNPGRLDDGLGPACIKKLEQLNLDPERFTLDSDYQLTLETAYEIAQHDRVIFIDASVSGDEPFSFEQVQNTNENEGFSTHSISPSALIQLTNCLYGKNVKAWILAIRGYEFDAFGEVISEKALAHLDKALAFLKAKVI